MSPRPGRVDRILEVDMPRPRGLAARRDPRFAALAEEVTDLFLARGVLSRGHGTVAT
jgi:NitT/TauT family transport system ATP-binding protein